MATTKKSTGRPKKSSASKSSPRKKIDEKAGKNKLGVKNSLVNNINARKKKGTSRPKKESTVSKQAYRDMQKKWGRHE